MVKASDNPFPSVFLDEQAADPATPAADRWRLFAKSGGIYARNAAGTVVGPFAAAGAAGELDYAQFTAPVSITATTEATANTVVTGAAVVYNGSQIVMIEFSCPYATPDVTSGSSLTFWLYEDGSSIGKFGLHIAQASVNAFTPIRLAHRKTPTNASHTYSVRCSLSAAGTGSVGAGAGGAGLYMPGFLRITRV